MPQMNFDLEDGQPPVSFVLKPEDCARFVAFMRECAEIERELTAVRAALRELLKANEEFQLAKTAPGGPRNGILPRAGTHGWQLNFGLANARLGTAIIFAESVLSKAAHCLAAGAGEKP